MITKLYNLRNKVFCCEDEMVEECLALMYHLRSQTFGCEEILMKINASQAHHSLC